MFQLCSRILLKQRFILRWINTDLKLAKGSLALRFHEYLNRNTDSSSLTKESLNNIQHFSVKQIDNEWLKKLEVETNVDDIFKNFAYIIQNIPNQVHNMTFYIEGIKVLLENQNVCEKEFVKLCYYIGFLKKNPIGPHYMKNLFKKYFDQLINQNQLTRTELAIISIACYKTGVRISNKIFHNRIIEEILDTSDNDHFLFVSFIKTLKHNQIYSDEVLHKTKTIIKENDLSYESLIHILPYVTEHTTKDDSLIQLICDKCIKTFNQQSRAKDMQKFIYSCALLNFKLSKDDLEKLEKMLLNRIKNEEFNTHFDHFVNATLSLWILNYHSQKLVNKLFNDDRFYKSGPYSRIKLDSRMKLLRTCVEIERPEWLKVNKKTSSFNASRPAPSYLIKPSLQKIMNREVNNKRNAIFVQQINNLNIAGILSTTNEGQIIYYEVLDNQTSLADRKSLNGIFQLKLRLLEKNNCKYQIVSVLQ
ncbi:hypothetical protein PVAND_010890 [Polypedilum vanderplanki]|uniref:Uncharacterized protein n=1 Tax=Polypedilum vanderplanki TaxID=319348 RepID=A0A9J6CHW3_POLVA|nr:hypothetical protein PVAND_010890 [Polypedilum vanderplanki]